VLERALGRVRSTEPFVTDSIPGHTLGVIRVARLSPNGQMMAVIDDVAPTVKVVDSGHVVFALHTPGDTTEDYQAPVIALSDTHLLVLSSDSTAGLYDWRRNVRVALPPVDFVPMSATALSDSAWVAYGPTISPRDGATNWVHCLTRATHGGWSWRSALANNAGTPIDSLTDPLMSVENGHAIFDHLSGTGSATVTVDCSGPAGTPSTRVLRSSVPELAATAPGMIATMPDSIARLPHLFASIRGTLFTIGEEVVSRRGHLWQAPDTQVVTSVRFVRNGAAGAERLGGAFEVMDSRADRGVLFAVNRPSATLLLLPADTVAALVRGTRAP
jgi:hypothetical protein